jgi:lysophospholipase L1-like esterase
MGDPTAAARAVRAERTRTIRALVPPNPRRPWQLPAPGVMASPPTITVGAAGGSNPIASPRTFDETTGAFRYFGSAVLAENTWDKISGRCSYWAADFDCDCAAFAFEHKVQSSAKFRVVVDGQPNALTGTAGQATGSGSAWVKVDFGSRGVRHVVVEMSENMTFGNLATASDEMVWRSMTDLGPRVVVAGDSYTQQAAPVSWSTEMARHLGWRDVYAIGNPGGGYLAVGNDARGTYRTLLPIQVTPSAPDVLIYQGGYNDASANRSKAAMQAEAELLFAAAMAANPSALLIVMAPQYPTGNPPQAAINARDGIQAACLSQNVHLFVDWIVTPTAGLTNLGWINGSGNTGATTGSGNADAYIGTDGLHPSTAGHAYLGRRAAQAIAQWIAAGMPRGARHAGTTLYDAQGNAV